MISIAEIEAVFKENKKRLILEFYETKELLFLLKKSCKQDLLQEEKIKVKEQLKDVLKFFIAFLIFMLPFGSIFLWLLIKFIPAILPSSFKEH